MSAFTNRYISITVSLVASAVVLPGLRPPLYIAQETATPISGDLTSVASATDVADLLTASQISAQAAEDLTAYFLQSRPPSIVYVATYDHDAGTPETPDDALDRAAAANTVFGIISQESRLDADLELAAVWAQARAWRYLVVGQSDDAGLLTSGKPAGLVDTELPYSVMFYSADGEPTAAGFAGVCGGHNLASQGTKSTAKLAMHTYVQGAALPAITDAQRAFLRANDGAALRELAAGASSAQRIVDQEVTYGGESFTSVVSLLYLVDRVEAELVALANRLASESEPLLTDVSGEVKVKQAVDKALAALAAAGHFRVGNDNNGVPLPDGYRSVPLAVGTVWTVAVTALFANEASAITVAITGEVA